MARLFFSLFNKGLIMIKIISLLAFASTVFINTAQAEGDIENGRA